MHHKIDTEEETDLQQNTVQRTTRAPDMLYLLALGEKIKPFPETELTIK